MTANTQQQTAQPMNEAETFAACARLLASDRRFAEAIISMALKRPYWAEFVKIAPSGSKILAPIWRARRFGERRQILPHGQKICLINELRDAARQEWRTHELVAILGIDPDDGQWGIVQNLLNIPGGMLDLTKSGWLVHPDTARIHWQEEQNGGNLYLAVRLDGYLVFRIGIPDDI